MDHREGLILVCSRNCEKQRLFHPNEIRCSPSFDPNIVAHNTQVRQRKAVGKVSASEAPCHVQIMQKAISDLKAEADELGEHRQQIKTEETRALMLHAQILELDTTNMKAPCCTRMTTGEVGDSKVAVANDQKIYPLAKKAKVWKLTAGPIGMVRTLKGGGTEMEATKTVQEVEVRRSANNIIWLGDTGKQHANKFRGRQVRFDRRDNEFLESTPPSSGVKVSCSKCCSMIILHYSKIMFCRVCMKIG